MTTKDTGGSAFPRSPHSGDASDDGMTLRDYFAAKAMQAFVSRWGGHDSHDEAGITYSRAAQHAYAMADSMLAARKAETTPPLERIVSAHWVKGGTGVTNFPRNLLPLYQAAVAKHGDPAIRLSSVPMTDGGGEQSDLYSLHHFEQGGLAEFWRVFDALKDKEES